MRLPSPLLLVTGFLSLLISCTSNEKRYTYAIKDFRKDLQPELIRIVNQGYISSTSLPESVTDLELRQLANSEIPHLRVVALRRMLESPDADQVAFLMDHLDDTAMVYVEKGEFGIHDMFVSDELFSHVRWKTTEARDKSRQLVVSRHNFLDAAYNILLAHPADPNLYSFIRQMAGRARRVSEDGYETDFGQREKALYGLAKFRKPEDREMIRKALETNFYELSNISLELIRDFPSPVWQPLLSKYYRQRFYTFSGNRRNGFTGVRFDRAEPEDFIDALVAQESDSSAVILSHMLDYLPTLPDFPDRLNVESELIRAISKQDCASFSRIRSKVLPKMKQLEKEDAQRPSFEVVVPDSASNEAIRKRYGFRWTDY